MTSVYKGETLDALNEATTALDASQALAGQVIFAIDETTSGTYTLTFQGRPVGGQLADWGTMTVTKLNGNSAVTTHTSGDALYRADASGLEVRVALTSWTSGVVVVYRAMVIG